MQHTDNAIAEFEAAFVEGMVEEFGEGYRSSAEFMLTDGSVIAKYAKRAWFASRRKLVIELPPKQQPAADDDKAWHRIRNRAIDECRRSVEAAGVTVRG